MRRTFFGGISCVRADVGALVFVAWGALLGVAFWIDGGHLAELVVVRQEPKSLMAKLLDVLAFVLLAIFAFATMVSPRFREAVTAHDDASATTRTVSFSWVRLQQYSQW